MAALLLVAAMLGSLTLGATTAGAAPPAPDDVELADGISAASHEIPDKCVDALGILESEICRLYQAFLQRDPDGAGLAYWSEQRAHRVPLIAVANVFVGSAEFVTTYGSLTDQQFVELVYLNVLGRPADSSGLAHWVSVLQRGESRGGVMVGFSNSPEFVARTHTQPVVPTEWLQTLRLYFAFFDRIPDTTGWTFWSVRRMQGLPLAQIADEFARSAEFVATYGALTNEQYVQLVYINVFDRPGDAVGVAHWTAMLDTGALSRGGVMASFSESPEYLLITDTMP